MLPDREYLEIEEISQIKGVTKSDLLDLYRRGEINLYAWCSEPYLIAFAKAQDKNKNYTIGTFKYSGVVSINSGYIDALLDGKATVSVEKFIIVEVKQVRNWSSLTPSRVSYPNDKFQYHQEVLDSPKSRFYSILSAHDTLEAIGSFQDALIAITEKNINTTYGKNTHDLLIKQKENLKNKLSITHKKFKISDLRFNKTEILKLITPKVEAETKTKTANTIRSPNPLDELVIKLSIANPGRSDHIWNLLRIESKKEIFDRKNDEGGILEEVSQTELIWRNPRTQQNKKLSRESFKNKYSRLKKKHGF